MSGVGRFLSIDSWYSHGKDAHLNQWMIVASCEKRKILNQTSLGLDLSILKKYILRVR